MGSAAIASASRVGSSSGSVLADSKTKYWVSDNSSYIVSYGSPGNYDAQGQLTEVNITGPDNQRNVKLLNDINGQVLQRTEVGYNNNATFDPQTRTYFFCGRQQGEISILVRT